MGKWEERGKEGSGEKGKRGRGGGTSGVHWAGRVFAKMIVKCESPNDANVADSVGCRSSRAALRGVIERIR